MRFMQRTSFYLYFSSFESKTFLNFWPLPSFLFWKLEYFLRSQFCVGKTRDLLMELHLLSFISVMDARSWAASCCERNTDESLLGTRRSFIVMLTLDMRLLRLLPQSAHLHWAPYASSFTFTAEPLPESTQPSAQSVCLCQKHNKKAEGSTVIFRWEVIWNLRWSFVKSLDAKKLNLFNGFVETSVLTVKASQAKCFFIFFRWNLAPLQIPCLLATTKARVKNLSRCLKWTCCFQDQRVLKRRGSP